MEDVYVRFVAKFFLLSSTIYSLVEFIKSGWNKTPEGKVVVNWHYALAIAFGLVLAYALPLDLFAVYGLYFEWDYVGEFFTGLLLGGFGAKAIYELPKLIQKPPA